MIINMNGAKAPETPSLNLQEKTVTPETLPTVIGADEGYTGLRQVTVNPDSQLIPTNIRSGKTIFGVEGSFVGEPVYTDTIDYGDITNGFSHEIEYPMGYVASTFTGLGDPVEIGVTSRKFCYGASWATIGYKNGALASYRSTNYTAPFFNTSTYIPDATWYDASATFNGTYECYLESHSSGVVGPDRTGVIKGTGWLCPIAIVYPYTSTPRPDNYQVRNDHVVSGDIIPVTIDTALTTDSSGKHFPIDVSAEIEVKFTKYSFQTFEWKAAGFAFIPNKVVIS